MTQQQITDDVLRIRRGKSRRESVQFTAIWLVFLLVPVILVAAFSEAGLFWDVIAYAAIVVFGLAYLLAFAYVPRHGVSEELEYRPYPGRLVIAVLVLVAIIAFGVPSLGVYVIAVTPYFAALGLYLLPLRAGLMWVGGTLLAAVVAMVLIGGELDLSAIIGSVVGIGFLIAFRVITEWSENDERNRLELAAVRERDEISRDVHDLLGHTLTVVSLKTQLARRTVRSAPDLAERELDEVLQQVQHALDEVRATVGRLRVPDLASQLAAAETALAASDVELVVHGSAESVPARFRTLFAWAVREAVTNVARHADATACTITLDGSTLVVTDDGRGLSDEYEDEGHGLAGLRQRVEDAGGRLSLGPATEGSAIERAADNRSATGNRADESSAVESRGDESRGDESRGIGVAATADSGTEGAVTEDVNRPGTRLAVTFA